MIHKPLPLNIGDTIGIIATSSHIVEERLQAGVKILHNLGYKTKIHPNAYLVNHQSAGSGKEKAHAYHDFIRDDDVKAIFSARGGNRAATMLEHLDFDLIRQYPKIFVGFSDTSILSMALESQAHLPSVFGHVVQTLLRALPNDISFLQRILSGECLSYPMNSAKIIKTGHVKGCAIGGTLSVFQGAMGSKYAADFSGRILFIEDIGEEYSHIDRKLAHLKLAGVFDSVSGVVFGNFSNMKDTGEPFGFTLEDMIREYTNCVKGPVIMDAPFGHEGDFYALPLGCEMELTAHDSVHLNMLESVTA
jgi:muramoyltetrapeptide carboxypeptidase